MAVATVVAATVVAATAVAVILAVATAAAATVAVIMAVATVVAVIMAVATVVAVIMAVATAAAATVAVILNLKLLTVINPLVQKDGKIEAMETLLKTQILKVEEAEEREAFPARIVPQIIKFSILFL